MPKMIGVQSTNISSIGYDSGAELLQVDFLNGSSYEYHGVPEAVWHEFLGAASKGVYLHRSIKPFYLAYRL
ncbi:KTSC domain-containing protein [Curtobacterium flaccumfaciens]|uniref:KTSC domain-containing protein n=2 Tax=Curtobacterium flaccumfaciens TaxID=2035 RepID=UPI001BDF000E|nr:KTSC domain-containing protein [Curtobacterium flaccumfaciens pv. betae]MBT1656028.1 KTSC domain-containing protein [Curtobacterium flaccumfaciens pv. betae]